MIAPRCRVGTPVFSVRGMMRLTHLAGLLEHSAMGALHSSGERVDAPKCHEQTREAVQKDILSGLSDGDGRQGLVWLTGPAGCGKTAIVGTVCDRLKACGRLAAAFYSYRSKMMDPYHTRVFRH